MIEFIKNNYEWFFSWLWVFIWTTIFYFFNKNEWINQKIESWNKSDNIQIWNINKK